MTLSKSAQCVILAACAAFLALPLSARSQIAVPESERSGTMKLDWRATGSEADYTQCTMSFEYATRDDRERVLNDWDVCLQGWGTKRKDYRLIVRTVTDDKSEIWSLGTLGFGNVTRESAKSKLAVRAPHDGTSKGAGFKPVVGHTYLVHTKDSDSDFWAKFTVTKVVPRDGVEIQWALLTTPQRKVAKDRKKRAEEELKRKQKQRDKKRRSRKISGR